MSEEQLIKADLERVHEILDDYGAPESRETLCASDRLSLLLLLFDETLTHTNTTT